MQMPTPADHLILVLVEPHTDVLRNGPSHFQPLSKTMPFDPNRLPHTNPPPCEFALDCIIAFRRRSGSFVGAVVPRTLGSLGFAVRSGLVIGCLLG